MEQDDQMVIEFSAHDRCDSCRAQAYTLAQHETFGELLFCLHHRKANSELLLDEGWTLVDDYEALSRLSPNFDVLV